MRHSHGLPSRLAQIADLQMLKTLASRGDLAGAQERRDIASAALDRADEALAGRTAEVDRLFTGATLDIAAIGIGRAVLAALIGERNASADELEIRRTEEDLRRSNWNIDRNLEARARDICRKASRHAAQKREDAASLEVALLRFAKATGERR